MIVEIIRLLRIPQWVKNCFVLAPLMFVGEFLDIDAVIKATVAFLLFCTASSATYIINDIHDRERDRKHPKKSKTRPIAAGTISVRQALYVLGLLYAILIYGYFILPQTILIIVAYLILNLAYTFALKNQPVIDIFIIAIGFVLRVYAGAMALSVPVSSWMFVTTLSLALYLAAIKRKQELANSGKEGRPVLQHYTESLVDRYAEIAATGALVFYSLFVMSSREELVITIPVVLYGIYRYWYVVEAKDAGESPSDALFGDWQLLLTTIIWVLLCAYILWPGK